MKTNKRFMVLVMVLVVMITVLTGCTRNVVDMGFATGNTSRFVSTGDKYFMGWDYEVFYDTETQIVYLIGSSANSSGICIMYDYEGEPMTLDKYEESKKFEEAKISEQEASWEKEYAEG